eukprot:TRINITY_DN66668_c4_g3_i5.p1 TRINITY_DN66668_c4_g3~~TRINITY_DN66668_c4_g3_i5.p1  ORF type:complete len:461 (+),score=34.03 TRINITY_DN66668_c4_g3_i5:299-1681(+)
MCPTQIWSPKTLLSWDGPGSAWGFTGPVTPSATSEVNSRGQLRWTKGTYPARPHSYQLGTLATTNPKVGGIQHFPVNRTTPGSSYMTYLHASSSKYSLWVTRYTGGGTGKKSQFCAVSNSDGKLGRCTETSHGFALMAHGTFKGSPIVVSWVSQSGGATFPVDFYTVDHTGAYKVGSATLNGAIATVAHALVSSDETELFLLVQNGPFIGTLSVVTCKIASSSFVCGPMKPVRTPQGNLGWGYAIPPAAIFEGKDKNTFWISVGLVVGEYTRHSIAFDMITKPAPTVVKLPGSTASFNGASIAGTFKDAFISLASAANANGKAQVTKFTSTPIHSGSCKNCMQANTANCTTANYSICNCKPGYFGLSCESKCPTACAKTGGQCAAKSGWCFCPRTGHVMKGSCEEPCTDKTCSGHGVCVGPHNTLPCSCYNSAFKGHWSGPTCSKCAKGWSGPDCKTKKL